VVFARDDDTTFGILHSRFHRAWALRKSMMPGKGNDPQYTPTEGFQTYPFPEGLTPNIPPSEYAADSRALHIAEAAHELHRLRDGWLKPADKVRCLPEVVEGFPDRVLPIDAAAATVLKTRTLTNLYRDRPTWLVNAHDAAVAAAYGWPADISEDDVLETLLELNGNRSGNAMQDSKEPAFAV
jgi:type II restriction/modification system DNA methylase subunit YeeA